MSEICYTFQKNLTQGNNLSFSYQNKQIPILVYIFRFSKKYNWIFRSKPQIFEIFQKNQLEEQMHEEMKGFGQKTIFR